MNEKTEERPVRNFNFLKKIYIPNNSYHERINIQSAN